MTRTLLATIVLSSVVPALAGGQPAAAAPLVFRISGADRYSTAAAISEVTFPSGVPVAYVATGLDFPDALAGGPAAAKNGGPILLTDPAALPSSTVNELQRLKPASIVVLGGVGAVSDNVVAALRPYTTGPVSRLQGPDRYATAAAVSAATFAPPVPVIYMTVGTTFPDALAASAAAGHLGGPVLLDGGTTTAAEEARLNPAKMIYLGGAVFDEALTQSAFQSPPPLTSIGGIDRYATAPLVSANAFPTAGTVYLASGSIPFDALAGSVAAAVGGAPLLLVPGQCLPVSAAAEIHRLNPSRVIILGGDAAVSPGVERLDNDLCPTVPPVTVPTPGDIGTLWNHTTAGSNGHISQLEPQLASSGGLPVSVSDGGTGMVSASMGMVVTPDNGANIVALWHNEKFVQFDSPNIDGKAPLIGSPGPGAIDLTYPIYAVNDPACCPSGSKTITYTWTGSGFVGGPPPRELGGAPQQGPPSVVYRP